MICGYDVGTMVGGEAIMVGRCGGTIQYKKDYDGGSIQRAVTEGHEPCSSHVTVHL
jgi:hypothetical protein